MRLAPVNPSPAHFIRVAINDGGPRPTADSVTTFDQESAKTCTQLSLLDRRELQRKTNLLLKGREQH